MTTETKPTEEQPSVIDASDTANEDWLRTVRKKREAQIAAGIDPDADSPPDADD